MGRKTWIVTPLGVGPGVDEIERYVRACREAGALRGPSVPSAGGARGPICSGAPLNDHQG